jgi:hypothetical protein
MLMCDLKTARRVFVDLHFLYNGEILLRPYPAECFKRDLMDHERMLFQKQPRPDLSMNRVT